MWVNLRRKPWDVRTRVGAEPQRGDRTSRQLETHVPPLRG